MRHRFVVTLAALTIGLVLVTACTDSGSKSGKNSGDATTTVFTLAPTTTFMPDCRPMPTPAALSAIVGIPMADGTVIATGTCEYRGLNDQTRVVTLSLFTDPADQAAFKDLVASVGSTLPLAGSSVAGAAVGPDARVFVAANNAIYAVQTNVTNAPMSQQVSTSVKVLAAWLKR
ncbi:MAG: hypothetical protein WCK21_03940 [Actinomycetota bacterium]